MSVPLSRDVDSPVCQANVSAVAVSQESFEGSDIIPFRDSEYEEIADDDLMFSHMIDSDADENSCRSAIEKNPEPLSSESMEAGLDSALGRSVSNPSLHLDSRNPIPAILVNEAEPAAKTSGVLDFGYSSEGHSNEEPENVTAGKCDPRKLTAGSLAVDKRLDEEAVSENLGSDSAGTSGIGTNTVQRRGIYHTTDASLYESATSNSVKSRLSSSIPREMVGEETDDDFTTLNELPLDDAPSASELDLLARLANLSDDNRQVRAHGRSLDSLAPLGSDKLFSVEKRVSSVEIIIDSVASSSRPSISSQISRESAAGDSNHILFPSCSTGHTLLAPSSCDASSEGTLSDSEFSDIGTSEGSESPVKSHPRARRIRKSVHSDPSKLQGSAAVKSPTKRHMESLLDPPVANSCMMRSVSCGGINSSQQPDCSKVKRSKICRSTSDLQVGKSPKKASVSRGCISPKKVALRRSAQKLNFGEDISYREPPSISTLAHGTGYKLHYLGQYVSQHSTGMYNVFPEHSIEVNVLNFIHWLLFIVISLSVQYPVQFLLFSFLSSLCCLCCTCICPFVAY